MLAKSVISKSGQAWKFWLVIAILLVGSFAPLFPATGITWTSGTVLVVLGYGLGMLLIRCARCSSKWFWEAAKDARVYGPLFKSASCPACAHTYDG